MLFVYLLMLLTRLLLMHDKEAPVSVIVVTICSQDGSCWCCTAPRCTGIP